MYARCRTDRIASGKPRGSNSNGCGDNAHFGGCDAVDRSGKPHHRTAFGKHRPGERDASPQRVDQPGDSGSDRNTLSFARRIAAGTG